MKVNAYVGVILGLLMLIIGPRFVRAANYDVCFSKCASWWRSLKTADKTVENILRLNKCDTKCKDGDPKGYKKADCEYDISAWKNVGWCDIKDCDQKCD